ncbi:MAG TPA: hypothetical protein VFL57_16170 [Bryobacteraceae bacterium]|nr:hypothetical protein [Bryobacteraceae bacterium]
MATAAQITANQQNAQRSTGPRTEAGKQTVSRNALAHGLAAKKFFVSEADKAVFAEFREALAEHYQPATDHERALVGEFVEAQWRLRNARTMETSFLEIAVEEQRKADSTITVERALARLFMDEALQKRMRLLMRYLAAAERAADKARKQLEAVIAERKCQEERRAELQAMLALHAPVMTTAGSPAPLPAPPADRVCSAPPQRC